MANLTLIHNAFDTNDKSVIQLKENELYTPLYNVIPKYIKDSRDFDFVFSVNGIITENLNVMLRRDDHLAVVPIPAGGGGGGAKNILRTVAMIALVVAAPYAAAGIIGATGAAVSAAGFYAVSAGVMVAGGLLINSIMPVQAVGTTSSDLESVSPTYSFTAASNASAEGTAIPIVLGKASITPPIISSYVSLSGDSQYLNILYALNDGKFDNIESISINDQDISNYEDIYYYKRLGTNDQDVISNFSDNITTNSDGRALNDTSTEVIYSTDSNAINEIQLGFLMPKGLYYIKDDGAYVNRRIEINILYREIGSSTWIDAPYYITIAANNDTGAMKLANTLVNESLVSSDPSTASTVTISDTFKTAKRIVFTIPGLDEGEYEVKMQRTSAYDTNTRVANDLTLEYVNEITYDDLAYPNVGLLSLNALATDQLSGGYPTVKIGVNNTYVRYWENDVLVTDTNKRLDNPAWAAYYILRKADFTDDNIDVAMFQEWADYCEAKDYTCNLVLDQKMELPDILNMITPLGRAKIIQKGTKWSVVIERVVDAPTQSFLFTSGNIVENSFSLDYVPYTDRANVVEVTYYDEDNDYQAMTVQAQSVNYDSSTDEYKTSITYYGCTKKQMAADYAQFLINNNRYITETVSFTAAIESLACNVGDVIKVGKKYLTNSLAEGRLLHTDGSVLVLDDSIIMELGKTYTIEIRKASDDLIYTYDVVNTDSETNEVTLVGATTTFDQFDVYSIGEEGTQSNLYRVVNISRSGDFERKISAIEYIPEVYDDTLTIPDEVVVSIAQTIVELKATDNSILNEDGTVADKLTISWIQRGNDTTQAVFVNGKIIGSSSNNLFVWDNPDRDAIYNIKVGDASITHTFLGTLSQPDAVDNISNSYSNGVVYLSWTANEETDFLHYELVVKGRTYRLVDNSLSLIDLDVGSYEVKIYAVNTSKVKSDLTTYTLTVRQPTLMFSIRDSYLIEQAFLDGEMTIFTSTTAPTANQKYDLWKVSVDNIAVDELAYSSAILQDITWESGQDYHLYKYWNGSDWIFCTPEQIAVARRMLGQLTEAGIVDNEVKIFSIQPYTPYEVNDLWLSGTTIKICTSSRASGSYDANDWGDASRDTLSVSSKLENIILTS